MWTERHFKNTPIYFIETGDNYMMNSGINGIGDVLEIDIKTGDVYADIDALSKIKYGEFMAKMFLMRYKKFLNENFDNVRHFTINDINRYSLPFYN